METLAGNMSKTEHSMKSLRTELVTRLEGRATLNSNTFLISNNIVESEKCFARAEAYNTAILDVNDIMSDQDELEKEALKKRIFDLELRILHNEVRINKIETLLKEVEKRIFPLINMLSISTNIMPPAKEGDVGYNLISNHEAVIPMNEVVNIHTGVKVKIPAGYWGMITARSSAVFKHKILVLPGVIDNGYTGELMVACAAIEKHRIIPAGTSIAQLILFPIITPDIEIVEELPKTERGESGFGSTGHT